MRIAVVGAGAIGGVLGAHLVRAGHEVALIARGAHLAAMRAHGLRIEEAWRGGETFTVAPWRCSDDPAGVGPVDAVFLTLKAHSLPPFAPRLAPLLGPETPVVTAMNGIPWWYFQRHGGPLEGTRLRSLDPEGAVERAIAPERVIGCIVFPASEIAEPGVIRHIEGHRFPLGEPDGQRSERARGLSRALIEAGFKAPVRPRIRHDIWVKLMGNLAFNPLSALTGATLQEMAEHPAARELVAAMMAEAVAVAGRLDVHMDITIDQRIEGARKIGAHKTSMLQDLEAGRPLELEAMVGAVLELGRLAGQPMPRTDAVYAAARLLEAVRQRAHG